MRDRTVFTLAFNDSSYKSSRLLYVEISTTLSLIIMKSIQRILADISYMIDDYPIPFAIFAIGMALVTHHYSGSWHSYVPTN